jgi:hypothetical protein
LRSRLLARLDALNVCLGMSDRFLERLSRCTASRASIRREIVLVELLLPLITKSRPLPDQDSIALALLLIRQVHYAAPSAIDRQEVE